MQIPLSVIMKRFCQKGVCSVDGWMVGWMDGQMADSLGGWMDDRIDDLPRICCCCWLCYYCYYCYELLFWA